MYFYRIVLLILLYVPLQIARRGQIVFWIELNIMFGETLRNLGHSLKSAIFLHFKCVTYFKAGISHKMYWFFPPPLLCVEFIAHKTGLGRLSEGICNLRWLRLSVCVSVFLCLWQLVGPTWLWVWSCAYPLKEACRLCLVVVQGFAFINKMESRECQCVESWLARFNPCGLWLKTDIWA